MVKIKLGKLEIAFKDKGLKIYEYFLKGKILKKKLLFKIKN